MREVNAHRVGVAAGAGTAAMLMLASIGRMSSDLFLWILVGFAALAGACLGSALVLAVDHVRRAPVVLVKVLVFLSWLTLLALLPSGIDAVRAYTFLAHADSTHVVARPYGRNDRDVWANYVVRDTVRGTYDKARRPVTKVKEGDSVWVYFDPKVPTRATIGRPGPDWNSTFRGLIALWVIAGVLFLGYGVNAELPGVPASWRVPVRQIRAYLGAAAMADVGLALSMVLLGTPPRFDDPRHEIASEFLPSLFVMAIPAFFLTLILGFLATLVLRERRWTSYLAYALCGLAFGALAGVVYLGSIGLLVGGIPGVLAAIAFRRLSFWGGAAFIDPEAATMPPSL